MSSTLRIPPSFKEGSDALTRFMMERSQAEVREAPEDPSPTHRGARPPAFLKAPDVMQVVKRVHPGTHVQTHASRPIETPPHPSRREAVEKMRLFNVMKENEQLKQRVQQLLMENGVWKEKYEALEKRLKEIDKIYES